MNPMNESVEIEYVFRTDPKSIFVEFDAEYEGKRVSGIIKEKEQATKEYKDNISKGNTAALVKND